MVERADGRGERAVEVDGLVRALAEAVPLLVERLSAVRPARSIVTRSSCWSGRCCATCCR